MLTEITVRVHTDSQLTDFFGELFFNFKIMEIIYSDFIYASFVQITFIFENDFIAMLFLDWNTQKEISPICCQASLPNHYRYFLVSERKMESLMAVLPLKYLH